MDYTTNCIVRTEGLKAEIRAFLKFSRDENGQPNVTPQQQTELKKLLRLLAEPELDGRVIAQIRTEFTALVG